VLVVTTAVASLPEVRRAAVLVLQEINRHWQMDERSRFGSGADQ
jgi:hypothetical protein